MSVAMSGAVVAITMRSIGQPRLSWRGASRRCSPRRKRSGRAGRARGWRCSSPSSAAFALPDTCCPRDGEPGIDASFFACLGYPKSDLPIRLTARALCTNRLRRTSCAAGARMQTIEQPSSGITVRMSEHYDLTLLDPDNKLGRDVRETCTASNDTMLTIRVPG